MGSVRHGRRLYKQMSLEVAVRNPERYADILVTFNKFEGRTLDDEGILDIYVALFVDEVVVSNKVDIANSSEEQIRDFIKENLHHNNEWGFPSGYQAAFTRYLKTLSEFGFIYAQYGQIFLLSEVAKALVNGKISLSEAFALQSMRFWRKSPYRRVLNDFNYFKFILQVIEELGNRNKKLSYPQFILSLFSDQGDVEGFIKLISENKIGDNMEQAYQLAQNIYKKGGGDYGEVCKFNTATRDYGNTVFRVLQLTGFITVEYNGVILLSINTQRKDLLDKLMMTDFSISESAKDNEIQYFKQLGSFDGKLLTLFMSGRQTRHGYSHAEYNLKLASIIDTYNLNETILATYLRDISFGKKDTGVFWYIQAPLKFEFLLSLYIYSILRDNFEFRPNYLSDDSVIPYSHAPGNIGDIEIFSKDIYWLIEATLIRGKNQQINNETINLFRHIDSSAQGARYMSLIAPYIHDDTELLIKVATIVTMTQKGQLIFAKPYSTDDFIEKMSQRECQKDIYDSTFRFIGQLSKQLQILTTNNSLILTPANT